MSEKECANCGSLRSKAQKEEKENEKVNTNIDQNELYNTFLKFLLENGEHQLSDHGLFKEDVDIFIENAIDDPFFHEELEEFIKDFIRKNGEDYGMLLNPNFR
ncbi:hypothetical protein H9S87_19015 (plasmid) [Bacillus pumilus]|uniref:hypothetical protein n=1 Tax=Bacillus pumilus TaxID=1408 RepID=UPI001657FFC7|nr:hypothetical protein [Bacillus pumilus]QNP18266.1 hypothetical protein H9S87_19015 [Bacillus pumilus]